jgi:hypothetical protein
MKVLANVLATVFIVAIALLLYDRTVIRSAQRIGVVDVGAVYRGKEAEFAQRIAKSASEGERAQAMQQAQRFAKRLPRALAELPQACRCLVILKSAVAGDTPNTVDMTNELKRRVDM